MLWESQNTPSLLLPAIVKTLALPADTVFDGIIDCLADGTLACLKKQFTAGSSQSPWKISKTIRNACEALGEKLEKADIDIILGEAGGLTEEKLTGLLLLRRVSGCMERKAYRWLPEEMAERNIGAAEVKSAV